MRVVIKDHPWDVFNKPIIKYSYPEDIIKSQKFGGVFGIVEYTNGKCELFTGDDGHWWSLSLFHKDWLDELDALFRRD